MNKNIRVLLVEDNLADADLTKETLEDHRDDLDIHIVRDGQAAMDYIFQRGIYSQAPRPNLILLDLNLPKLGGREVLGELKKSKDHHCIPVVILSSSDSEADVAGSYALGASSYVTKPVGFEAFQAVVRAVNQFWFNAVTLPS